MPEIPGCRPIRMLGKGGSGEAWLVEQSRPFERLLVAKVFRPQPDASSMLARFERERAAIAALGRTGPSDPGLAAIHDAGIAADGRPYVLMQFIDGAAIDAAAAGLALAERVELVRQCCVALAGAHDAGLVHQDITPANVLVSLRSDGARHVTVIDFGLAASAGTRAMLLGTPDWMAPEQSASRASQITPAADVWALGRMLGHLATPPRDARERALETEIAALAKDCTAGEPRLRPPNARAVLERIDRAVVRAHRAKARRVAQRLVAALAFAAVGVAAYAALSADRWSGIPADATDLIARDFGAAGSAALPAGWEARNVPVGAWILSTERDGSRTILAGEGTDGAHAQVAVPLAEPVAPDAAYWLEWTMRATAPSNKDNDESDLFVIVGSGECQLVLEPRRDRFVVMRDHKQATRGGVERAEVPGLGFAVHDAWIRYRVARGAGLATSLVIERTDLATGKSSTARVELVQPPSAPCGPAAELVLAVQERQRLEIGEIRLFR